MIYTECSDIIKDNYLYLLKTNKSSEDILINLVGSKFVVYPVCSAIIKDSYLWLFMCCQGYLFMTVQIA